MTERPDELTDPDGDDLDDVIDEDHDESLDEHLDAGSGPIRIDVDPEPGADR